jgi:AcrR family transcriptional regulator
LLEAGIELAAEDGLHGWSTGSVAKRAGLAKGTFYVHFPSRDDFLVDLHRLCSDRLHRRIEQRAWPVTPGYGRLAAGVTEFLECCLDQRGATTVLLEGRFEPALKTETTRRTEAACAALSSELRHDGRPLLTSETSLLLVVATVEVARAEMEAGRRLARQRAALLSLVKSAC